MLRIAAAASHHTVLGDAPTDLRGPLQALSGQALRRINRYIELAVLGALQCRAASRGIAPDTALYLAAEAPMLADCIKALTSLIAQQRPPTPFEFMNISGNMAGFYIAQQLGILGPQLVVHRHGAGLQCALELLPLQGVRQRRSLIGYVEEGIWPLTDLRERLQLPAGRPLAECSHWLYLDADCEQPLALLDEVLRLTSTDEVDACLARQAAATVRIGGSGLSEMECQRWNLRRDPASVEAHSTGAAAGALVNYALGGVTGDFLHIDRGGDGACCIIRATRP